MTLRQSQPHHHNHHHQQHQQHQQQHHPSDYDSDFTLEPLDSSMAPDDTATPSIPAPTRTNEDLNLAVLQRHNPSISSILSLAPYAVVYLFSATTQLWEKIGVEGTLFVCQLTHGALGEERYSVIVLNRRGMENFEAQLNDGEDVELTDEYVILKVEKNLSSEKNGKRMSGAIKTPEGREAVIYGLWIFSEPPPSSTAETRALNAQFIKECAVHGRRSRKLAEERVEAERSQAAAAGQSAVLPDEAAPGSVPMGRQISLKELFGQQRAQDDEWSVRMHSPAGTAENEPGYTMPHQYPGGYPHPPPPNWPAHMQPPQPPAPPPPPPGPPDVAGNDVLGNLFRRAGLFPGAPPPQP